MSRSASARLESAGGAADSARVKVIVRRVGWGLIAAQLIGLLLWSAHVDARVGMSWDFAAYYQPWWAIAHGHLNPAATAMPGGYPFWRNDGEFIIWLLAPLYWLFPNHQLGLWWIQDLALAGISAVCFRWVGELLPWEVGLPPRANLIPAVGWLLAACLLVLNPWIYWSATFAVQMEPFGVLFAMLALRALMQERRTVWLWCLLGALCGSASIVFVVSAALVGVAARGRHRYLEGRERPDAWSHSMPSSLRVPVAIIAGGVVWLVVLGALHATQSFSNPAISVHQDLAYLNGTGTEGKLLLLRTVANVVIHPIRVVRVIASHALNLWADTSPVGFVGLLSGPGFFMAAPTLLENSLLKGQDFSYPGFPSLVAYVALSVGTALVVVDVLRRRRIWGIALTVLILVNAAVWCALWLPKTGSEYLKIDATAARALDSAANEIPPGAEVIASQGFVGRFAGRDRIYVFGDPSSDLTGPEIFPVAARQVWFVLSADQGIEVSSTAETDQAIGSVAALAGATLVGDADGVWVFRWAPVGRARTVALGGPDTAIPAWATGGVAARAQLTGRPSGWSLRSNGGSGYVLSGDISRLESGHYLAEVTMASAVRTNVEVWNDASAGDKLLGRSTVVVKRTRTVTIPFSVGAAPPAPSSTGTAPFDYEPEPPPRASSIEVRVWTPGKGLVEVKRLAITRVSGT